MYRVFALFLILLVPDSMALAGSATGTVDSVHSANHSAAVLFTLNAPIEGTPRCNEAGRFAFDLRQPGGRAMLQILLSAKENGYTVSVQGLNTCSSEWKSEDVKNIVVR